MYENRRATVELKLISASMALAIWGREIFNEKVQNLKRNYTIGLILWLD
jgi:hypothetical protein